MASPKVMEVGSDEELISVLKRPTDEMVVQEYELRPGESEVDAMNRIVKEVFGTAPKPRTE